jgi:hypothetical protein
MSNNRTGSEKCNWDNGGSVFCVKWYNGKDSHGYCFIIYQIIPFPTSKFKLLHCFKIDLEHSVSKIPELIFHFLAIHLHIEVSLHRNHFIIFFPINIQQ